MDVMSSRSETVSVPVLSMTSLYHVGDMDRASKRTDSYEGAGLSVCLHPSAWRRIARGHVGGTTHRLVNPQGSFVDAHALDEAMRHGILAWAVARGLAEPARIWTVSWDEEDDDGEERRRCFVFDDARKAAEEAEEYEESDVEIVDAMGHRSTPELLALTMQTQTELGDSGVIDLVLPIWAHEVHGIDGVWWNDRFQPWSLSAPRGVIRPEALSAWTIEPIGYDPDDEDQDDDGDEDEE